MTLLCADCLVIGVSVICIDFFDISLSFLILFVQLLQVGREFASSNLASQLEQEVTLTLALRERISSN